LPLDVNDILLFQIARDCGLYGDPDFRRAIQKDQEDIVHLLTLVLTTDAEEEAAISLQDANAQRFMNVIQHTVSSTYIMTPLNLRQRPSDHPPSTNHSISRLIVHKRSCPELVTPYRIPCLFEVGNSRTMNPSP